MKGWYKMACNRTPHPARIMLAQITAERVELYRWVSPPWESIPIEMAPFTIDDSIPLMDGIE